ncbi:MAG: serine hydrolase [Phycisphaerae bacterium]|nr:serine hydrolase [Phycisphaerae bacterium]
MHYPSLARLALVASVFMATRIAGAAEGPSIPEDVKKSVQERVDNGYSVGIVVGMVDPNGTSLFCYGKPSKQSDRRVDENTIYEIGSITKVFTALAMALLAQDGKLQFDDPVDKYLPQGVKAPARGAKKMTLRHLAMHTSGLPRMPSNFDSKDPADPYAGYAPERLYEFLDGCTLARDVDANYEYSNLGAGLLGVVLSRVAGVPYERLVVDRICDPLGMKDTRITLSPDQAKRLAKGHAGGKAVKNWTFDAFAGAGALRSSAKDMLRFLSAAAGLTKTPLASAFQATMRPRRETGAPGMDIALGWHVFTKFGTEIIWHNGGTGGYRSFCGFVPKTKTGVLILSNSTDDPDDLGLHALQSKYPLKTVRKTTTATAGNLDDYVGYYQLQQDVVFTVRREGDQLMVRLTGQPEVPVYPEAKDKFFYKIVDAQITFRRDDKGKVDRLVLHQGGIDQTAAKLGPDYKPPPPKKEISLDPKALRPYVGKYKLASGDVFDIKLSDDGKLMVRLGSQPTFPVFPESQTKFFYKVVEAQIEFVRDKDGNVESLILHQHGLHLPAKKIE